MTLQLSRWRLTIPSGASYTPAREKLPWFDVKTSTWEFMCPQVAGYQDGEPDISPRTELRELNSSGGSAKWRLAYGDHKLNARLIIDHVVDRLIIGQIHADEDEPVKIHVERDGTCYATDDVVGNSVKHSLGVLALGVPTEYTIYGNRTRLAIDLQQGTEPVRHVEWPTDPHWLSSARSFYFKAGMYCITKNSDADPTEVYRARFQHVLASHY
jgi:hypothetical protein